MTVATVTSSTYLVGVPQVDGRVWVTETHTISDGSERVMEYLAPPDADFTAALAAHVANINSALAFVPPRVRLSQAHSAIENAGLKAQVDAAVAAADQATQDLWYRAEWVERNNPILLALAAQLGLTSAQVDDLFRAAALL